MYEQLDIFDITRPAFQIDKPIRLIELFAGIGSQAMALRDLGASFEHYKVVELDRFSTASYNAIHGTDFGTTNICNINGSDLGICGTDRFCYIMTYSFPCQDLSAAGKKKGMAKGSGTRSGLLWEVERLLNGCSELPQVLLMENVPQVHSKANMPDFQKWVNFLSGKGYSNYWQDLNAKDYGVAQNRNRCFMVSLLGEWNYKFPQPIPLERKLKDYLEYEVDEEYYVSSKKAQKLIRTLIKNGILRNGCDYEMEGNFNQRGKVHGEESICRTILGSGHAGNEPKVIIVGNINPSGRGMNGNVHAGDLCPTITTNKGEGAKVLAPERISRNPMAMQSGGEDDMALGNVCINDRGFLGKEPQISIGTAPTLRAETHGNLPKVIQSQCRIRKLTPLECWRLMGFLDGDFRRAEKVNSKSQLYKQAGNSIVKNVLMAILGQMKGEWRQCLNTAITTWTACRE